jgi:osmotically-inducible protein OsmY
MSEAEQPAYRATHIQEALANDRRVNEPNLRVSIRSGRVLVTGSVPTEQRRDVITDVLEELCPDLEIENGTTVGPGGNGSGGR